MQTLADGADFTVTPVAKEKAATKRTIDYYDAEEDTELGIGICSAGTETDRSVIKIDNSCTARYAAGEDAAKLWSLSGAAPEVYTLDGDGNPMSVDCRPANENMTIPLGVKVPAAGEYELRPAIRCRASTDAKIYLRDTFTGARTQLTEGGRSIRLHRRCSRRIQRPLRD